MYHCGFNSLLSFVLGARMLVVEVVFLLELLVWRRSADSS